MKARQQRTPDGPKENRFVEIVCQPVRNPSGDVVGIFAQGVDVTERLAASQAALRSAAEFRALAEAMPNHVSTSAPNGILDWFYQRVYEYSGASSGELDGTGWTRLVHSEDLPLAAENWSKTLSEGVFYETEFRLRRHDGVYRWYIARAMLYATLMVRLKSGLGPTPTLRTRSE